MEEADRGVRVRTILVAILMAAGGKLLADEVKEWLNWLPAKLIRWASKRFPPETQRRLEEEWLAHFNDLGPAKNDPSSFNFISTDLELANQRISSRVIDVDGYGVDVDGSGSVSVSGSDELNYRGLAEITTKEGFFTNTIARLSGATLKDGKLQFPFRIGGTIDNPVFSKGKGDVDIDAGQKHR